MERIINIDRIAGVVRYGLTSSEYFELPHCDEFKNVLIDSTVNVKISTSGEVKDNQCDVVLRGTVLQKLENEVLLSFGGLIARFNQEKLGVQTLEENVLMELTFE